MSLLSTQSFTLTADQQNASNALCAFLCNPDQKYFVLKGYSGTGKSTLVKQFITKDLPRILQTIHLLAPSAPEYSLELTATTNKAAENLEHLTGYPVQTIHSLLSLVPRKDYSTGKTFLTVKNNSVDPLWKSILIVDEASYIDWQLLKLIERQTKECKVIFIGDPAQLTPVMSTDTPAFNKGYPEAELIEVVRNQGKILELATGFRHAVTSGTFTGFTPDGNEVVHVSQNDFEFMISQEFSRKDWNCWDSRVLTWTNERAIQYNNFVMEVVSGSPDFKVDDYAIVNSFVPGSGSNSLATGASVVISSIEPYESYDVPGNLYGLHGVKTKYFMPLNLKDKDKTIKKFVANNDIQTAQAIDKSWIDLRGAYASTINKAQGSTYSKVFIDVADIAKCRSGDQIARMMYVATSRAKHQVILTGDFG
jgi:hypothetical protein